MDLAMVKKFAAEGESATVEFKKSTADLQGACKSLCGMLNAGKFGCVVIGIAGGKLVGQEITDRTQQEIAQCIKEFTPDPQIQFSIALLQGQLGIILLEGQSHAEKRPYFCRGKAYLRVGTTTTILSRDRLEALFVEQHRQRHPFDKLKAHGFSLEDIDHEWVLRAVELGIAANRLSPSARGPVEEILAKFKLIDLHQIANAAVILFGKMGPRLPIQCKLMMARFKGTEKGEFLDHKQFIGNAFQILDEGMMFLSRHLSLSGKLEKGAIQRIDKPLIPTEALREALVNAICHRDYEHPGSSIHLAIYEDRVEITSSGGLMPGIQASDLKKPHKSILRNPLIAQIFYYVGYVEQWGQGTLKIAKLCLDYGLPEPQFTEHPLWFEVSFRMAIRTWISPKDVLNSETRRQKILEVLHFRGRLSTKELEDELSFMSRRTIQRELQLLKDERKVEAVSSGIHVLWRLFQD